MDSVTENQIKKRKCKQEEEDHPRNGMDTLPRDVALDILSRLPITSLIQFGFVCRSWKNLSRDPRLVNLHFPCLIFHCDYPIRNQLYFAEFSNQGDGKEKVRRIHTPFCSSMPEFSVVGSCNGLMCLSDSLYNDALFIYNPFTGNYRELPQTRKYHEQEVLFGFGFHSMRNEYKVVKIVYYWNSYYPPWGYCRTRIRDCSQSDVQIYSVGSNTWRSIGRVPYQLERRSSEAFLVNGRLHWVTRLGRYYGVFSRIIVSFDLSDERFREVPRPDFGGLKRCNYHLAVLGGCLSAVVYSKNGKLEIWVMQEYDLKESWTKEFKIEAYSPAILNRDLRRSYGIWRNYLNGRMVRVLCLLKNGKILLEYKGGTLASYDQESGKFKKLVLQGMPNLFQTFVHIGSLNWIDTPIDV